MNNSTPLISVIIPVYKVEAYLNQCVQSVINQSYKNLEIILVNDGSPDSCPKMCDDYAEADSRIKVIHKANGGLASARNVGIDNATGDYIAFVDSDDWIEPETYEKMMEFAKCQELDIVCCEISRVQCGKKIRRYRFFPTGTIKTGKEITKKILLDKIGSQVVKGLYKATCWKDVRFPIGMLYEDIPTTFKAFSRADKIGFIAEPFYLYRENDTGISLSPNPIKPYHQYLGFKEHYIYSLTDFPEISIQCCANTALYAISTCFHYYSERNTLLKEPTKECEAFLKENKKTILKFKSYRTSRKLAFFVFYYLKPLFAGMCRIFCLTGLQKALHFDVK